MFVLVPVSIYLLRHFDPRTVRRLGFSAFAAANLWGTQLTHDWAREDFVGIVLLQSIGQALRCCRSSSLLLSNVDPYPRDGVCRLYPDHAARRRRDRRGADGHLAARARADPFQLSRPAHPKRHLRCRRACSSSSRIILPAMARAQPRRGRWGRWRRWVQREANVLAYIDGFWLCFWLAMAALCFVALITRAPPGPFTPAPFGFAKRCAAEVRGDRVVMGRRGSRTDNACRRAAHANGLHSTYSECRKPFITAVDSKYSHGRAVSYVGGIIAFSSEVDCGSRQENASKQRLEPGSDLIRTERKAGTAT